MMLRLVRRRYWGPTIRRCDVSTTAVNSAWCFQARGTRRSTYGTRAHRQVFGFVSNALIAVSFFHSSKYVCDPRAMVHVYLGSMRVCVAFCRDGLKSSITHSTARQGVHYGTERLPIGGGHVRTARMYLRCAQHGTGRAKTRIVAQTSNPGHSLLARSSQLRCVADLRVHSFVCMCMYVCMYVGVSFFLCVCVCVCVCV